MLSDRGGMLDQLGPDATIEADEVRRFQPPSATRRYCGSANRWRWRADLREACRAVSNRTPRPQPALGKLASLVRALSELSEPKPYHRRIEILADTDQRASARRLARDYAKRNFASYVVTVPDSLGPKADLNDVLRQLGSTAVLMAIEDAERFTEEPSRYGALQFDLEIGSDIEIAKKVLEQLEKLYGPIIVIARLWRFDKTHWAALDDDHLVRLVRHTEPEPELTLLLNKLKLDLPAQLSPKITAVPVPPTPL